MRTLLITLFSLLSINMSLAQSGWGYVNYTSYKTHAGNGSTTQYPAFAYDAAGFDNILNTANSNTTITHTGEVPLSYVYNGSLQTPHWSSDFYAIVFEFWFVPQETGTYSFGINSDDASDLFIDGSAVATYYGGHGASAFQTGTKSMIAGQRYKVVLRYQEYGGGDVLYFRWYKPSGTGGWGYWNNEVTNIPVVPTKQAKMNFDFGGTLDKTKFSIGSPIGSNGWIDVTNLVDSTKINTGYKSLTTAGQVEWCVVYDYDSYNKRYRVGIDSRQMTVTPSEVNQLKLFDLWDGPVTFSSYDPNGWSEYFIYTTAPLNFSNSSYSANIRAGAGYYALRADFSYTPTSSYKQQKLIITTNNLSTLYNSIVTVSDVYLAFKELQNGGIFGNQTGNEFTYGIQYKNADVNDDDVFNEADCFKLLQHLTGKKNLVDTFNLNKTLKLILPTTYANIGKTNWNTFPTFLGDTISFNINTGKSIDTFYYSGTWKGDVNLSHSATPPSNGITTMGANFGMRTMSVSTDATAYVISQIVGDSLVSTIKFNPNINSIVGVQFQLNYDNSILNYTGTYFKTTGSPTNFEVNKSTYINFGSLNTSGELLDSTTEYRVVFKLNRQIPNSLGLISIASTEAVNKDGKIIKIKVQ